MPLMPRIEKPQSPDVFDTIAKIKNFCELNRISVNHLARLSGISQSALYRFLDDDRKTVTPAAKEVLKIIDSWHKRDNAGNNIKELDKHTVSEIMNAALELWDGDPATVGILSEFLKAMNPLYQVVLAHRHRSG